MESFGLEQVHSHVSPVRRRKTAAERRAQTRRAEGRTALSLVRAFKAILAHRGNYLGTVGLVLFSALSPAPQAQKVHQQVPTVGMLPPALHSAAPVVASVVQPAAASASALGKIDHPRGHLPALRRPFLFYVWSISRLRLCIRLCRCLWLRL